jgi:hypothetical protein
MAELASLKISELMRLISSSPSHNVAFCSRVILHLPVPSGSRANHTARFVCLDPTEDALHPVEIDVIWQARSLLPPTDVDEGVHVRLVRLQVR